MGAIFSEVRLWGGGVEKRSGGSGELELFWSPREGDMGGHGEEGFGDS